MTKQKKPRGRPMKRKYPPRIDATPEERAQANVDSLVTRPV